MRSPLAAREAAEGLLSSSSLSSGGGQEGLGMAGGLSSQLLGIDQLRKINKNRCVLNHHHKKTDAPGSWLCVGCEWYGRVSFRSHSSSGADHFQSLCVTSKTRF